MKKLLLVATLSIAVAAVIKRVAELEKRLSFCEENIGTLMKITRI